MKQDLFKQLCVSYGLPEPEAEVRFHPTRRFRFDFLFRDAMLAIEINGGVWINGRHNRGKGYLRDMEKLNEAQLLGYTVIQVTPQQVESGEAFELIKRAIGGGE